MFRRFACRISIILITQFHTALVSFGQNRNAETPLPRLPEGLSSAMVFRVKKCREVLTANGLSEDALGSAGLKLHAFPEGSLSELATIVIALLKGDGDRSGAALVTLANPCSMDTFMKMAGKLGAGDIEGDENFRTGFIERDGVKYERSVRRFSPQEYLFSEHRPGRMRVQPAKALSQLRAAVAATDHLVWAAIGKEVLPETLTAGEFPAGMQISEVRAMVRCPGDLLLHAEATLPTPKDAANAAKLLEMMIPIVPAVDGVPPGLMPQRKLSSFGSITMLDINIPKASLGLSVAAFAGGFAHAFNGSQTRRDAQIMTVVHAAARTAGSKAIQDAKTVEEIIALLEKGVSPGGGASADYLFEAKVIPPTDEARKAVADLLTLQGGKLILKSDVVSSIEQLDRTEEQARRIVDAMPEPVRSTVRAKRNAQNLASAHAAACAAGSMDLPKAKTLRDAIDMLGKGVNGAGNFSTSTFKVSLSENEITAAMKFLTLETGEFPVMRYSGQTE
jgi:hypothetical protein